jgi:ABC-2 type transport system ATP-binding protein
MTSSSDVVLSCQGLRKTFRIGFFRKQVPAVTDATFEVYRGEVFGLVGHNGAGKTTTIKMMMGLIAPDAGHGHILGVPISEHRARLKVGFLPESPHFYDYLRPTELLEFFADLYGLDKVTRKRRIPELMERVGLKGAEEKQLRKFSKGMLQRLGLAQALLPDSDIVLLDEPQSGLDPLGRKDVRDIIVSLRDAGKTVIFSSHVLPDVEHVCHRIAIMTRGKVVRSGPISEILDPADRGVEIILEARDPAKRPALPEGLGVTTALPNQQVQVVVPSKAESDQALQQLIGSGWTVVNVLRRREHLEEVFVRETLGPKQDATP